MDLVADDGRPERQAGAVGVACGGGPGRLLVEARSVSVRLDRRTVLDSVTMAVHSGEIVTLIGLNGSGKSTLVRVMLGLLKPAGGSVFRASGLRIGYSPQHFQRDLVFPLTVRRFLTLGESAALVDPGAALEEVGAVGVIDSPLSQISGGELQRVMLARALLRKPELLVLDEPLAGVDIAGQGELYGLVAALRDRYGCGVLLVSHDLHLVMAATDQVICLNRHVCCAGTPQKIVQSDEFVSLFGAHVAESFAVYTHAHDHRHDSRALP